MIQLISPKAAAPICTGSESFISFCTPEREVKVDEPVKFMDMNDEMAPTIRYQAMISMILVPKTLANNNRVAISQPMSRPFSENRLKGIHGSSIGVSTQPET